VGVTGWWTIGWGVLSGSPLGVAGLSAAAMGMAGGPVVPPHGEQLAVRVPVRWACEAWCCGRVELRGVAGALSGVARRGGGRGVGVAPPVGGLAGGAAPTGKGRPGGVEAEWSEQTARVVGSLTPKEAGTRAAPWPSVVGEASDFAREMLALVDTASPIAAVDASYQQVGRVLVDMVESAEQGAAAGLNVGQLARAAFARGLINSANLNAVEGLGVMHTMAVLDTNGERLEPAKAREFVALVEAVLYALRTQARP
jgi:hypothetical protein